MGLRVKAKTMGFRNGRRVHPGAEFALEDGASVPKWVEVLGGEVVEKRPKRAKAEAPVEVVQSEVVS